MPLPKAAPVEKEDLRDLRTERLIAANARLQDKVLELLRLERTRSVERAQFRAIVDQIPDYVFLKDTESRFVVANKAVAADLDLEPDDMIGKSDMELHPSEERARKFRRDEKTVMETGRSLLDIEEYIVQPNGRRKYMKTSKVPFRNEAGQIVGLIGVCRDVTDRKLAEDEVQFLAHHDPLTRLPNRTLFTDRLDQAILKARRDERWVAVAFIDLDRFKAVNDGLGHDAGDKLLKTVANRMSKCIRDTDTLARMGGDEFVILFADQPESTSVLSETLERLRRAIAEPVALEGEKVGVTASMGLAVFPNDGTDAETLLKNADAAMYQAKIAGRDGFRFYADDLNTEAEDRLSLLFALRNAVTLNQLRLEYQPQVDLRSGRIVATEALLRWDHPELGTIPPDEFIPVAEESGLIVSLGEWVLNTASRQNKAWQDAGLPPVRVAVNVSAIQFRERNFVRRVERALAESGLEPRYLELELTESALMRDVNEAIAIMRALQATGVCFAIDDFGMGYSSLSALSKFPVARLKIDRSFVQDLCDDENQHITTAVVALGQKLKMKVIAEGVETDEQLSFLSQHHCDEVQGFRFSRPVGEERMATLLREQAKA